jgi:SagB-type dehydrogenase family enzyme
MMNHNLEQVRAYHQRTKHSFRRYARGPSHLDWATQPDAFRCYEGASRLALERIAPAGEPAYEPSFWIGHVEPAKLDRKSLSQLFFDSLALSAWKQAGNTRWALRVNPSSGNLHPTEGYLVCGPVNGVTGSPVVAHYTPREHALEVRARFALETWQALMAELPANAFLVGLTSIHWREAWKYGERAFRYCQHDVGHAIAAISMAAAGLGWEATLLDELGTGQVAHLLGTGDPQGAEPEHPDCVLAVYPQGQSCPSLSLPSDVLASFTNLGWQGRPNQLSRGHVEWSIIDDVAAATKKPPTRGAYGAPMEQKANEDWAVAAEPLVSSPVSLRRIIRQRRSAVAMDPRGTMARELFYKVLRKTLARSGQCPFNALPWRPLANLVLFVHRVEDLAPGLYLLIRDGSQDGTLRAELSSAFAWEKPPACPEHLPLYRLERGDARAVARQVSCHQEIASDGCFSLGMLAEFKEPLARFGPWFYRRLFWECGLIGQVLYLEAEAADMRGTGIGCFFDDAVHQLLGLETMHFQSLYHFTVGYAVEDRRLTTLPAYP